MSPRAESLCRGGPTEIEEKNPDELDVALPRLTRRYQREYKNLDALDPAKFGNQLHRIPDLTTTPSQKGLASLYRVYHFINKNEYK